MKSIPTPANPVPLPSTVWPLPIGTEQVFSDGARHRGDLGSAAALVIQFLQRNRLVNPASASYGHPEAMDLSSYLIMGAALASGAIVKGATGMGLPLVALPVLTAVFGLQHAVGLMVIPLIVTNAWQVWRFRGEAGSAGLGFLPLFLVGGVVGIVIGSWLLTTLPERVLVLGLGIMLLVYVALRLFNPHFIVSETIARRFGPLAGAGGGILQGATGISAPIGVTFIHAMSFERDAHVFAVSAMFLTFAVCQLPSLWLLGVMQPEWLLQGVLALLPILLFMPLGQAIAGKLSRRAFDRLILIFLGLIGLKMLVGL